MVVIDNLGDLLTYSHEEEVDKITVRNIIHPLIRRDDIYLNILKTDSLLEEDSENVRRVTHFLMRMWSRDEDYGGVKLTDLKRGSNITLEVIDTYLPLNILRHLKIQKDVIGTLIYRYSEEFVRTHRPPAIIAQRPLDDMIERLIIGENAIIDCTGLSIQHLVLFNIRCVKNLSKARKINTLVVVHGIDEKIRLPTCPGLNTLVIPQEQDVEYTFMKTKIPSIIGFIPSKFQPSAFARGIQLAREPFEKSRMEEEVFDMYSRAFIKTD